MFVHRSDRVETYMKVIEKFIENRRKMVRKHKEKIESRELYC